jgi:ankyrin repeat protein
LTANRLAEPIRDVSHYHIRLEAAHAILAQTCIGVLLRLDNHVDRDKIEGFPLAQYAAQYWPTHARFEKVSSCIKDGMESLFDADKPQFATWLWVYDEDRGRFMPTTCPEKPGAVPLYYAAMLGFRDLAEHLIAKYPEHVNARGGKELTPVHVAAYKGHADILSLLLEHGADLEGRGKYNGTPLLRTSDNGNLEAGRCLLDHGADINARDRDDWTPLIPAAIGEHVEFARMLLKRGAEIDARVRANETPLHFAVRHGKIRFVRLLLEHGADVNARDNRGRTPSQMATKNQHEIVELLSEYGAEPVK